MTRILFNPKQFILFWLLLITEIAIALFVRDNFVRPYLGDTLVILLMFCLVRSFFDIPSFPLASAILAFAFFIETLQYFRFIEWAGLSHNQLAAVLLGTHFSVFDLLAYLIGFQIIVYSSKESRQPESSTCFRA